MKVLVVEDETRILKYLKQGLEAQAYVVDTATDGEAGLDLATAETYDVIILDRMLPKLSGIEISRQLRKEQISTPILLLTAKNAVTDRIEGLDAGADDYLGKPFSFSELLARIRALSRRPKQVGQQIMTADNLVVDLSARTVHRAETAIHLSKKEYALLEYFLRRQGEVVSAERLIAEVWEYDSDVTRNTARVYVGYLRSKIDGQFPAYPPLIHTVRGFGYRLGVNA